MVTTRLSYDVISGLTGTNSTSIARGDHSHGQYEISSNKTLSLTSACTDTQYPSAKAIYDIITEDEYTLAAALNDINDQLDNKASSTHTHTSTAITNFNDAVKVVKVNSAFTADNADTLDGKHASDFSLTGHTHSQYSTTGHTHSQYASTGHNHSGVYAELDSNGKVPSSQLPSYVDDVLEYANKSNFPSTGETGKIYVALDTNITYRWGGSEYVEISPSIALGVTESTAYRGDLGKIAYDHSQSSHAYLPLSGGTVTGDIIPSSSNLYLGDENHHWNEIHGNRLHLACFPGCRMGGRIDFGDTEDNDSMSYTYIGEIQDDVLSIQAHNTVRLSSRGVNYEDYAAESLNGGYDIQISRYNGIIAREYNNSSVIKSRNLLEDNDTKNTAGSTNTNDKIYLVGAKSQTADTQTYSHSNVYVGTDHCLYSNGSKVATDNAVVHTTGNETVAGKKTFTSEIGITASASMQYDSTNECIKFIFN